MASDTTNVPLPAELVKKFEKRIENTSFDSVSSYIAYILRQILASEGKKPESKEADSKKQADEMKDKRIERLKSLGYLD